MEDLRLKECKVCGAQIEAIASVCNQCLSYQAVWKNHLRYIANVIGILTIVSGVIVFIISMAPEVRKAIIWRDEIQILSFNSIKAVSIANLGDGEVFVSHIQIESDMPGFSKAERLDISVPPEKAVSVPRDERDIAHIRGNYSVAATSDLDAHRSLLSQANRPEDQACVLRVVATPTDPGYLTFKKRYGDDLVTFDVEGWVHSYSLKMETWYQQEVPLVGYLLVANDRSKCSNEIQ